MLLTEALPTESPPERAWDALEAAYAQRAPAQALTLPSERPTQEAPVADMPARPASYSWPLAACAALVFAVGSFFWGVSSYSTLRRVQADEHLLRRYLARPDVQKVALENVLGSGRDEPLGSALLTAERPAREVLVVLGEDAPEGRAYQAWGHTSSDWDPARGEALESLRVSADNVFEVDAAGFASLYLSLEPAGGSPQPTNPLSKVSLLNPVASAPLEITTPESGSAVRSDSLIVSGVLEPTLTSLGYTLNGGPPTQTAFANNRFSFTVTGLQEGDNTVEVRGVTEDGEAVSAAVRVTYSP